MGISISSKMSGWGKWAEAHQPTKADEARTGANEDVIPAADDLLGGKALDQQPHRPWLVPGTGRL
jgi:hypothetical protein